jgi:hypothetical protein
MRTPKEIAEMGLSSGCTLHHLVLMAITLRGDEHPCDRCNMDRKVCRGFPRADGCNVDAPAAEATAE